MSDNRHSIIQPHGGYRKLRSYRTAEIVYDATIVFCDRFISKSSRIHDQMVQAARSGKQNIAEGCMASGASKKIELKLIGIAKASIEELMLDYEDFLRQRKLPIWEKNSPEAQAVKKLAWKVDRSYETYKTYVEASPPERAANVLLCLINQTNYLLDRQLKKLETAFLTEGGFSERMYRAHSMWKC